MVTDHSPVPSSALNAAVSRVAENSSSKNGVSCQPSGHGPLPPSLKTKLNCVPKSSQPASGITFHPPHTTHWPVGLIKVTIRSDGQPPEPNTLLKFTVTESSGPSASTIQVVSVWDCPPFRGTANDKVSAHCAWDCSAPRLRARPSRRLRHQDNKFGFVLMPVISKKRMKKPHTSQRLVRGF